MGRSRLSDREGQDYEEVTEGQARLMLVVVGAYGDCELGVLQ